MSVSRLPKGGADFRMEGISGFRAKLNSLIRYGDYSSLQDNKEIVLRIFSEQQDNIRRYGKIPSMARRQAYVRFCSEAGTTRDDERKFKRILDNYK